MWLRIKKKSFDMGDETVVYNRLEGQLGALSQKSRFWQTYKSMALRPFATITKVFSEYKCHAIFFFFYILTKLQR